MEEGGQSQAPPTVPPGLIRYPLSRGLDGPQGRSGWMWKISPPPGFDPRTVQLRASCYTDRYRGPQTDNFSTKIFTVQKPTTKGKLLYYLFWVISPHMHFMC